MAVAHAASGRRSAGRAAAVTGMGAEDVVARLRLAWLNPAYTWL